MDIVTTLENSYVILNSDDEQKKTELQFVSIHFICFLLEQCQERGAFNLEQATEIKVIIDRMKSGDEKNVDIENQKKDLAFLFECIENAHSKNKLSLKECHFAFLAIQSFIYQKNDTI